MKATLVLVLLAIVLLAAAGYLFYTALNRGANERVLQRLNQGRVVVKPEKPGMQRLERAFLRAGMGRPAERMKLVLAVWGLAIVFGYLLADWLGLLAGLLGVPFTLRMYVSWRYRKRVLRMIEQLPQMLDHTVRSLKSGRTLADAVLHGIEAADQPLRDGMARIERNVQLGVSLPDAAHDFAELYERDELHLFALGLRVNHRYGGNASELMENLIKLIREREQMSRQLKAMTGETRLTAVVLGALPISLAGYFMLSSPEYLLHMWNDNSGQKMLLVAFAMQVTGCLLLWRMLRSI
ncbi:type II secretion system, protein F domain [Pseudomonas sp. StFLB209]|uniref:type II secretion system F family protein n=1 Tax=Pseudomonas sp. StFLB209 TaxID=1028989 RepID=UPI0004F933C6|nr:type II secretion system F family protein [Pseudomonas sp. StFLB209]BAP41815.1 type II secretion system, protein F domain [Pseudomonas sp. StFLB209]